MHLFYVIENKTIHLVSKFSIKLTLKQKTEEFSYFNSFYPSKGDRS